MIRHFSISCHLQTDKESGNLDGVGTEDQPPEWVPPSSRKDSILRNDSELKSLLQDMASDFGHDESPDAKNSSSMQKQETSEKPLSEGTNKAARVAINDNMNVVYFDGTGSKGGFGRVEPDLNKGSVQATIEDDMEGSMKRRANGKVICNL